MSAKSNISSHTNERHGSDPFSSAQSPARRVNDRQYEREFIARRTNPEQILQSVRDDDRIVIALDLDQCSCIGEDSCDILNVIGLLTNGFTKSRADILDIATKIINPNLKPAFEKLKRRYVDPLVVIYTAKGSLVTQVGKYFNAMGIRPKFNFDNSNFVFDMDNILSSFDYITNQLRQSLPEGVVLDKNIQSAVDRLSIVSWAISFVLELPYAATVFVTRIAKDLQLIALALQIPFKNIYLFDDKANEHALILSKTLEQAHMIPVKKYNFSSLSQAHGSSLQEALRSKFPIDAAKFSPKFTDMVTYKGESPPFGMQSIVKNPDDASLEWRLANLSMQPVEDPEQGYPLHQIPDPVAPQPFTLRYSGGRSLSDQ